MAKKTVLKIYTYFEYLHILYCCLPLARTYEIWKEGAESRSVRYGGNRGNGAHERHREHREQPTETGAYAFRKENTARFL